MTETTKLDKNRELSTKNRLKHNSTFPLLLLKKIL